MKKILFVINTLGGAGAETALLELLRSLSPREYEISLFVLLNQGEMVDQLPSHVRLLNADFCRESVLGREGKKRLNRYVFRTLFRRGSVFRNLPYLIKNLVSMVRKGKLLPDKLLWRVKSDGAPAPEEFYDLAVAYLEGGSAYFVADHVMAAKKAGFIHIDYGKAGYTRSLDLDCYASFDQIYMVSDEVRRHFLETM